MLIIISYQPTVSAASLLDCDETLNYNDTGTNVKTLQTELNTITDCALEIDGIFGSKTKTCVENFQKKYNLEVDGIVGIKTCRRLNSAYKIEIKKNYAVVTAKKLNVRKSTSLNADILGTLNQGDITRIYSAKKVNNITWYKIRFLKTDGNYSTGYIHSDYAQKNAILLDISEQKLTFYRNGKKYLQAAVVTGNLGNHDTPTGHYTLNVKDKQTNTYLTGFNDDGSTYRAYVKYWLPFINDRGIGFHDASWRTEDEFNTTTYTSNGSHGCVNMQEKDAQKLYLSITQNTDVIVID